MKTETIKGWIHWQPAKSYQEAMFKWWAWEQVDNYVMVCPHDITFVVPETWNPVAVELAQIEATREQVKQRFTENMRLLDERVANLMSIGYAKEVSP